MQVVVFIIGLVLLMIGIMLFGAGMILNPIGFNVQWFIIPGGGLITGAGLLIAWSNRL